MTFGLKYLILGFLLIELILNLLLDFLNLKNLKKYKDNCPADLQDVYDAENYSKALGYNRDKLQLSVITTLVNTFLIFFIILSGWLAPLENAVLSLPMHPYFQSWFFLFILSAASFVINLPFRIYGIFGIEERYGFNKTTAKTFILDLLKSGILSAVISLIVLFALFSFKDLTGELWWLWAYFFYAGFQLLASIVYPYLIAPVFNKFSPLEDGPLRDRLENLAEELNFSVNDLYVMDSSRRSSRGNAYFTGFGRFRRIVLFDTLINSGMSDEELSAVLAHEIGHQKKKHVLFNIMLSLAVMAVLFAGLGFLYDFTPLYSVFSVNPGSYHGIVLILIILSGPLGLIISLPQSILSRKFEFDADEFAARAMGSGDYLIEGLKKLSRDNLSNPVPHKAYSFYHYSHPVLAERIQALKNGKENRNIPQ